MAIDVNYFSELPLHLILTNLVYYMAPPAITSLLVPLTDTYVPCI